MAKRLAASIALVAPGRGTKEAGTGPQVVIEGDPGELTLFGAGRQGVARVEIRGDPGLVARVRTESFGI